MLYFDFHYYSKVLAFTWRHKEWPKRYKTLFLLLVVVPLSTAFHGLCLALDYVFYPALWRQKVVAPVFIVGHARSGTTLMHRLLAADGERFSYFYYWQTFFPALTQRAAIRAIASIDKKMLGGAIERRLRAWDEKKFGPTRHIHNQGLWVPEEDQFVMRAAFVTQQWSLLLPIMNELDIFHIDDLAEKRRRRWMAFYKACVKRQLVDNGCTKTHLSKNPVMSGWLRAIIKTFPDAKIVVLVRDPAQCIPSTLRLLEINWKGNKWKPADYEAAQIELIRTCIDSFKLPAQVLQEYPHTLHQFVDYRDLTKAPTQTVKSAYAALGLDISEDFNDYLVQREQSEKQHSSDYKYDLNNYALSLEEIELELETFYQQYEWPRSREHWQGRELK